MLSSTKMITGYDGYRRNATTGNLVGTGYEYMGNLEIHGLREDIMSKVGEALIIFTDAARIDE